MAGSRADGMAAQRLDQLDQFVPQVVVILDDQQVSHHRSSYRSGE